MDLIQSAIRLFTLYLYPYLSYFHWQDEFDQDIQEHAGGGLQGVVQEYDVSDFAEQWQR
jgi:hypothetical protein